MRTDSQNLRLSSPVLFNGARIYKPDRKYRITYARALVLSMRTAYGPCQTGVVLYSHQVHQNHFRASGHEL